MLNFYLFLAIIAATYAVMGGCFVAGGFKGKWRDYTKEQRRRIIQVGILAPILFVAGMMAAQFIGWVDYETATWW